MCVWKFRYLSTMHCFAERKGYYTGRFDQVHGVFSVVLQQEGLQCSQYLSSSGWFIRNFRAAENANGDQNRSRLWH